MRRFGLGLGVVVGCVPADVAPTVSITAPVEGQELLGYNTLLARASATDDGAAVRVEFAIDGEPAGQGSGNGCERGCFATAALDLSGLADGEHELTATATDLNGRTAEAFPVVFSVHDIPYVHSIAVDDAMEGGLNGPDLEVEVHLLHDAEARWMGCARLPDVQQEDLLYENLRAPFLANQAEEVVRFADIGLEVARVVVVESDGGTHCPIWPELTEDLQSDVDELYGVSPPVDLTLLFSGPITPSVSGVTGLEIRRGRPFGG